MRRPSQSGFSLIELMAVVVIIGVLAVIAVVGYRKWKGSARTSEATHMIDEIRKAQTRYFGETGSYLDVSLDFSDASLYPTAPLNPKPGTFVTQWGKACQVCKVNNDWSNLSIEVHEPVMYGYATMADGDQCDPACKGITIPINGTNINFQSLNGGAIQKPWYVAIARGDTDGNGVECTVVGESFTNMIQIDHEGE